MKIAMVEKLLNISRETVRYYEKEGLISPKQYDNRYREYEDEDIRQLKTILILRRIGVSIADIRSLFKGELKLGTVISNNVDDLYARKADIEHAIELSNEISGCEFSELDADTIFDRVCDLSE